LSYESTIKWNVLEVDVNQVESTDLYENMNKTVSNMIKYHRKKKGWSQLKLAMELGLTPEQGRHLIKDYETRDLYTPKEEGVNIF
jgi:ribosome-binding protein aMBF1 (putative translation factor)